MQYIAPALGGLKLQAGYQSVDPDEAGSKASTAVALSYAAGPLSLAAVTQTQTTADGERTHALGASYDLGVAKVALNYSPTPGAKGTMVSVVAPVAGVNLGLQVAKNSETTARGTELFVNKEVLKNTFAYAELLNGKNGDGEKQRAYAVGVIYTF